MGGLVGLWQQLIRCVRETYHPLKQGVVVRMPSARLADGRIQREIRLLDRIGCFGYGQPDIPQAGCGHGNE